MKQKLEPKVYRKTTVFGWLWLIVLSIVPMSAGLLLREFNIVALAIVSLVIYFTTLWLGLKNLKKLELEFSLPKRCYSGKSIEVNFTLSNRKIFQSVQELNVSFKLEKNRDLVLDFPYIPIDGEVECKKRLTWTMRGHCNQLYIKYWSMFPLGLFMFESYMTRDAALVVCPHLVRPLELDAIGSLKSDAPHEGFNIGEQSGEFRGIRAWQQGDLPKSIHWRASSKSLIQGRGLRVKEYDPPGNYPEHVVILFHSFAQAGAVYRTDRFELAISLLAGTLNAMRGVAASVQVSADFIGWVEKDTSEKADYVRFLELLASVSRYEDTEKEVLQHKIDYWSELADKVIVVSDMELQSYAEELNILENVHLIDILQFKYKNKYFSAAS